MLKVVIGKKREKVDTNSEVNKKIFKCQKVEETHIYSNKSGSNDLSCFDVLY